MKSEARCLARLILPCLLALPRIAHATVELTKPSVLFLPVDDKNIGLGCPGRLCYRDKYQRELDSLAGSPIFAKIEAEPKALVKRNRSVPVPGGKVPAPRESDSAEVTLQWSL